MSVQICFEILPLSHVSLLHPQIITGYENKKSFDTWIFLFWFCKLKLKRFLLSTFSPRCKPSKLDDEGLIFYQVLDHQQTFYLAISQHFKLPIPAAAFIVTGLHGLLFVMVIILEQRQCGTSCHYGDWRLSPSSCKVIKCFLLFESCYKRAPFPVLKGLMMQSFSRQFIFMN